MADISSDNFSANNIANTNLPDNEQATPVTLPFKFTGNTREYFGIWIINILLTILTLGIYSAWAKVRTNRYFYGNTLLDDAPFDYLANPVAILKGWAIAIVIFAIYSITVHFFPASQLIFMLLLFLALPWLVVRSLAFRLYNSSYRNLRFRFDRQYGKAAKIFIGFGLLVPLSLGLLTPSYIYRQKRFIVDHSHYGKTPFQFKAFESSFYKIYGIAIGMLILAGIVFSILVPFIAHQYVASGNGLMLNQAAPGNSPKPPLAILIAMYSAMAIVYLFFFSYINTRIYNTMWNGTVLGNNRFESTLRVKNMAWLYVSNAVAILLSVGLLIPWARIRMARYKLRNMTMHAAGNLDNFVADESRRVSATGEELGEVFDIDIGF